MKHEAEQLEFPWPKDYPEKCPKCGALVFLIAASHSNRVVEVYCAGCSYWAYV